MGGGNEAGQLGIFCRHGKCSNMRRARLSAHEASIKRISVGVFARSAAELFRRALHEMVGVDGNGGRW